MLLFNFESCLFLSETLLAFVVERVCSDTRIRMHAYFCYAASKEDLCLRLLVICSFVRCLFYFCFLVAGTDDSVLVVVMIAFVVIIIIFVVSAVIVVAIPFAMFNHSQINAQRLE